MDGEGEGGKGKVGSNSVPITTSSLDFTETNGSGLQKCLLHAQTHRGTGLVISLLLDRMMKIARK